MLKVVSTIVVILLVMGFINRRQRWVHIPVMASAFVIDIALVLYIEANRGVVGGVARGEYYDALMMVHLPASIAAVLLYIPLITFGILLARNKNRYRPFHKWTAYSFLFFRGVNYITSLMIA